MTFPVDTFVGFHAIGFNIILSVVAMACPAQLARCPAAPHMTRAWLPAVHYPF